MVSFWMKIIDLDESISQNLSMVTRGVYRHFE